MYVHHQARENLSLSLYTVTGTEITNKCLVQSARNFFSKLREAYPKRPPPLVLALDEAHVPVMTDRGGSVPESLLDIFSSVLADLKQASADWNDIIHFATIFLSTNLELNNVAPSTDTGQIASQRSYATSLAGALTCVPFDVFVDNGLLRTSLV